MPAGDLIAILAAVAVVLVTAVSGISVYLSSRRGASGKVDTTEASVLWQQAQDMRSMLITEKTRAEQQRDRLITAYTEKIVPVLSEVNNAVIDLAETTSEILDIVRRSSASPEGGGRAGSQDSPSYVRPD